MINFLILLDQRSMKLFILCVLFAVSVTAFAQQGPSLIPFRKEKKWGYSDSTKKMIIAASYDMAFPFSQGKGIVQAGNGKMLQIDAAGKILLALPYTSGYYVHDYGYIKVDNKLHKRGLIKTNGQIILPALYDDIEVLGIDSFEVRKNEKKGVVNGSQKVLKEFAAYNPDEMNDFFMTGGKDLCPKPCLYAPYSEHMAVTAHKGLFGYADEKKEIVIPCKYKMAGSFYAGCAWVMYEAPGQEHKNEVINGVYHSHAIILNEGFIDKYGTEYWED